MYAVCVSVDAHVPLFLCVCVCGVGKCMMYVLVWTHMQLLLWVCGMGKCMLYVLVWTHTCHCSCVAVRTQLVGMSFLSPTCESYGQNRGPQPWQQHMNKSLGSNQNPNYLCGFRHNVWPWFLCVEKRGLKKNFTKLFWILSSRFFFPCLVQYTTWDTFLAAILCSNTYTGQLRQLAREGSVWGTGTKVRSSGGGLDLSFFWLTEKLGVNCKLQSSGQKNSPKQKGNSTLGKLLLGGHRASQQLRCSEATSGGQKTPWRVLWQLLKLNDSYHQQLLK